jgi:hypothetical protein
MLTLLLFPLLPRSHSRCFPAAVPAVTAHLNPPVPIHTIPPALPSCSYPLPLVLARLCTSPLVCACPRSFILLVVVLVLPWFVRTTAPATTASAAGTGAAVLAAIAAAGAARTPARPPSLPPAGFLVHCCCPCCRCAYTCTRVLPLAGVGAVLVPLALLPMLLLLLSPPLLLQLHRHCRCFHVAPACCRCCCHCSYTCTRVLPLTGLVGVSFGTSL